MYKNNPELDREELVGKLIFKNDTLKWIKMPSQGIVSTVMEPLDFGEKQFDPNTDPKGWIEHLYLRFTGTYFSVSKPIYISDNGDHFVKIDPDEDESDIQKSMVNIFPEDILPGELANQNSAPVKVDAVEDQKSRTPQESNKEPFYEKMLMKAVINDWFYGMSTNADKNELLIDLKSRLSDVSKGSEDSASEVFSKVSNILRKSNSLYTIKKELENVFETEK